MRKFVCILLALCAVPVMAAPTITLNPLSATSVEVLYDANGTDLVSGFGLTVTVDAGTIDAVTDANASYWVHPSNIVIASGVVTDEGSPAVEVLPAQTVTLEFGALYERGVDTPPAASGKLCVLTVSGASNISLTTDNAQGGIVTEAYAQYTDVTASATLAAPADLWDGTTCTGQVLGDTNCDGAVNFLDLGALKTAFFKNCGVAGYNFGADFNHDGSVNFLDLGILKTNFFTSGYTANPGTPDPVACP